MASSSKATSQLGVGLKGLYETAELELHERLIALRHEALAHSSYARKPVGRIEGNMRGFLLSGRPFDILSERINHKFLLTMSTKLVAHCERKMSELNRQIVLAESAA